MSPTRNRRTCISMCILAILLSSPLKTCHGPSLEQIWITKGYFVSEVAWLKFSGPVLLEKSLQTNRRMDRRQTSGNQITEKMGPTWVPQQTYILVYKGLTLVKNVIKYTQFTWKFYIFTPYLSINPSFGKIDNAQRQER